MYGMKKVIFKQLKIQNFLSVGNDIVEIKFNKGLNIITGINHDKPDRQNAVGKSTIADALYFAIFGDTLREIKKDLIVNNITGGRTIVELDFAVQLSNVTNNYNIVRTLSPTKISIFENGVDKTRDSIANTTKYICEVISASPAIFQNCVIMTVNNAVPFMAKTKIEKRKFIEDIFGMEIFSNMASQLKQEYNDVKKNYDVYITRLSDAKKNLNEYNEQKQKVVDKKQEKKELYLQRQKSNTSEIEQCTNILKEEKKLLKIEDINSSIVELQNKIVDCDNKITDLVEQLTVNKTNLSFQKDRLQKIGTDSDVCPVCLRSIEEHDREHIDNEKNNLKTAILKLAEDINALLARTTRAKEIKNQINKTIQQKNTLLNETSIQLQNIINTKSRLKQLLEWQEELKHDINNLKSNETEFDELITNITNTIKTIQQGVDGINKQLYRLDIVKFIVSEEGVKSYIVNKLLELLNSKLYYYLKKLDSNSICVFNEYFEEEIVNEKNKICSYFNFSGAERKSIDLACLFAFSDIRRMQGGVSYNIAIYDELFDSSFDSKGIDLIIDILIERARLYDENSFVISHRRESLKAVTGDVIYLEKRDGITKRIEYSEI